MADGDALYGFAGGDVEDCGVGSLEGGDEGEFSVGGDFEAVGTADIGVDGFGDFFVGEVDDGDGSVLSVGDPEFFAVGCDVEAFVAVADGDDGFNVALEIWIAGWWAAGTGSACGGTGTTGRRAA